MQEIMNFAGKYPILSISWIVLLFLLIVTTISGMFSKVNAVTRAEATRMINKDNALVVDVRQSEDYRKGHIHGAINVTATEIKQGQYGELRKHQARKLIIVCANGHNASQLASRLSAAGFEQITILKEGISGWIGENLPLTRGK